MSSWERHLKWWMSGRRRDHCGKKELQGLDLLSGNTTDLQVNFFKDDKYPGVSGVFSSGKFNLPFGCHKPSLLLPLPGFQFLTQTLSSCTHTLTPHVSGWFIICSVPKAAVIHPNSDTHLSCLRDSSLRGSFWPCWVAHRREEALRAEDCCRRGSAWRTAFSWLVVRIWIRIPDIQKSYVASEHRRIFPVLRKILHFNMTRCVNAAACLRC